jgi:archaeosine-15-forming tRNA-guanine transglycosylase
MKKKTTLLAFIVFALVTGGYVLYDTIKYPKGQVVIKQMSELSEDGRRMYYVITEEGQEFDYLYAEEIAQALITDNWNKAINEDLRLFPRYQYQLTLEDDSLIVTDFNRHVASLPYNKIGKLDDVLIADNE